MSIYGPNAAPPPRARPASPPEHAFFRVSKRLAVIAVAAVLAILGLYLATES
jgi:hypothetical protein